MLNRSNQFCWCLLICCPAILLTKLGQAQPLTTGKELQQSRIEHSQDIGSFPVNMIVSPDGQFAITTDIGYRQAIWAIRFSDGTGHGQITFPNKEAAKEAIRKFDKAAESEKPGFSDVGEEGESPELGKPLSRRSLRHTASITAWRWPPMVRSTPPKERTIRSRFYRLTQTARSHPSRVLKRMPTIFRQASRSMSGVISTWRTSTLAARIRLRLPAA